VHNTDRQKSHSTTNHAIENRFLQRKFARAGILLIFTDRTDSYEGRCASLAWMGSMSA
jgi:hypothetical protein